ncbi:MAG: hypothetical protein V7K30_03330 [Nostoc sp.]
MLINHGEKLAVIEAKKRDLPDTEGLGQAKKYKIKCSDSQSDVVIA